MSTEKCDIMDIPENKYAKVGEKLKILRGKLSQSEMAKRLNVTLRSYQRYESGERPPPIRSLAELVEAYKIPLEWILNEDIDLEGALQYEGYSKSPLEREDLSVQTLVCPPELKPLVDAFIEVMTSNNEGMKLALSQNTLMFRQAVRDAERVSKLETDIESIKKTLWRIRDTDFKTQEPQGGSEHPGEENRVGGKESK